MEARNPDDPLIGQTLGGCRLEAKLGQGGMGTVYRATQLSLRRPVAVKVLPATLVQSNASTIERFEREARAVASLQHPNIVSVHDMGRAEGGVYYIVMELVDGETLGQRIGREGRLPEALSLEVLAQSAAALGAAHRRGIVHRDIKPENLLLSRDGIVKVADFGLARDTTSQSQITQTGLILGTPAYMSPEQAQGRPADARSDLYSLGATLFAMLAGDPPFTADTPLAVALQHVHAPVPDPRERGATVSDRTVGMLRRLMSKEPGQRYPSAEELLKELGYRARVTPPPPASAFLPGEAAPTPGTMMVSQPDGTVLVVSGAKTTARPAAATPAPPPAHAPAPGTGAPPRPSPAPPGPARSRTLLLAAVGVPSVAVLVAAGVLLGGRSSGPAAPGPPTVLLRIVEPRGGTLLARREIEVTVSVEGGGAEDRPVFSGGAAGGPPTPGTFRGISGGTDVRAATGVVALPEGDAEIRVAFPGAEVASVRVRVDSTPPSLAPDPGPGEEAPTREATARIAGSVTDASEVSVAAAGTPAPVSGGRFSAEVALREGRNEVVVVARDEAGHEARRTIERWRDSRPPAIRAIPPGPLEWRDGLSAWIAVEADEPLSGVEAGGARGEVSGARGSVQVPVAGPGEHRIRVAARDRAGNEAEEEVSVSVRAPAASGRETGPDPEEALAGDLRSAEGHPDRPTAIASLRAFLARSPPPGLAKRARARLEALEAEAARETASSRASERLSAAESEAALAKDWRGRALVWTRVLRDEPGGATADAARKRLAAVLPAGLRAGDAAGQFQSEADGAILLLVPGGRARLGSKGGYPEERPPHEADLSPFLLDRECVTVARYARFLEALRTAKDAREAHGACHPGEGPGKDHTPDRWREQQKKGDLPVAGVDWFDAFAYAHWAGRELPSEAQWERAASYDPAGTTRTYPWGEAAPEGGRANLLSAGRRAPFPAATFAAGASALGILDLSGNVAEWCADWYDPTFYARPEGSMPDPLNRRPSRSRSIRGGSFQSEPLRLRCASREGLGPHARSPAVGFRCAK